MSMPSGPRRIVTLVLFLLLVLVCAWLIGFATGVWFPDPSMGDQSRSSVR